MIVFFPKYNITSDTTRSRRKDDYLGDKTADAGCDTFDKSEQRTPSGIAACGTSKHKPRTGLCVTDDEDMDDEICI